MTTQPDLMLAKLILDYLKDEASIAAGVPADDVLPKDIMDSGNKNPPPALIVAAKEEKSSGGHRKILVCPMILTWLKSADAGAAPVEIQTTREMASTWLRAIDARLRDLGAFGAWASALPRDRRNGWRLLALPRFGGDFPPLYRDGSAAVTYGLTMTFHIIVGDDVV